MRIPQQAKDRPYGQPSPALDGTISGLQNGDDITASSSTTATASSAPGAYPITAALADPAIALADAGDDVSVDAGALFTRTGSFSDPGDDTWTAAVDYGDGGGAQPLALDGASFTLSHTYY